MFEQAIAQPIFPTHIWLHALKQEDASRLNRDILAGLDKRMKPLPAIGPGQSWQSSQDLHHFPEFAELVTIFTGASKSVLDAMEVAYESFEITGCWANINPPGAPHPPHTHANNYLSGVYYVQMPDGAGTICYHDPRQQRDILEPKFKKLNKFNSLFQNVKVDAGTLIIFPSWLGHSVPPNPTQGDRISVSFNIMFSDYARTISPPRWTGIQLKKD